MEIDRELVVGREDADLTIPDPEISRRHAALRPVEQGVEVEDLHSLNGTRVGGRRITGPLVLSTTGTIVLGKSELRIDVQLPQATRVSHPAAAAPSGADVTAPRKSPVAGRDVTVQRKADSPPVAPPAPAPDEPVAPAARSRSPAAPVTPKPAPEPRPAPAQAPPAPPKAPPGPPAEVAGPPRRTRGTTIALVAAALLVGLAVALLALANTGSSSSTHTLDATIRAGVVNRSPTALLLAGVQSGPPTEDGAVTMDVNFRSGNALSLTSPARFSARLVHRFDNGSMTSIVSGTATPAGNGAISYSGTGQFTGGTAKYDGAGGRYQLTGTIDAQGTGQLLLKGTVKY